MTDRFVIRVVVGALAIGVLGGLVILGLLSWDEKTIPDQLDRLVTFLAGGLVGILVRTSSAPEAETVITSTEPANIDVAATASPLFVDDAPPDVLAPLDEIDDDDVGR